MMNTREQPGRGSRRVASWVYEVINPLLEAIPVEISFLEKGNATWRFYNGELEHLRPIRGYLTPEGRHVHRDFLRTDGDAGRQFDKHDELLQRLSSVAAKAHTKLLAREDFTQRVRQTLAEFRNSDPSAQYPGGAFPEERFPALVGERVVNAVSRVPSHYTDSDFWKEYGDEFLKFAEGAEFETLLDTRMALLEHDRGLLDWLENKSFDLCTQYDVPAAPSLGFV